MDTPPQKMPESGFFKPVWVQFNRLREYAQSIAPLQSSRGVKVSRTSNGTLLNVELAKAVSGTAKQFRLVSIENDYYACLEWDGENTGAEVNIAKDFNLRHTGWHGQTIIYPLPQYPGTPGQLQLTYNYLAPDYRTATGSINGSSVTEHQIIQPVLIPNETVIFAVRSENGTGVEDADEWIEIGPRAFTKVA